MNPRRLLGPLPIKLSIVAVLAVVVAALVVPGLAGATAAPSINTPTDGSSLGIGDRDISFTANDGTAVHWDLFRDALPSGTCSPTVPNGLSPVDGNNDGSDLIDSDSITFGDYCYWVESTDGVTPIADSNPVEIHYDATPPTLVFGSIPGASSSDLTPTFHYTAQSGTTVTCTLNGDPVTSGCGSSSVTLDFTTATAHSTDGAYTLDVTATDAANNATTITDTWNVDTTAPAFTLDGAKPALLSSDPNPTFAYTAEVGSTITCSLDGTPFTTGCTFASATFAAADGSRHLVVTDTDAAGNATSDSYTWTVDTSAPAAPTSVTAVHSVTNAAPSVTVATSTDAHGPVEYQLLRGGVAVGSGTWTQSTTLTDPDTLSDGTTYVYTVRARDSLQNTSSASTASASIAYDTSGPSAPANLHVTSGSAWRKTAVSISFDASSDPHGPVTYQLLRDGAAVGTASTSTTLSDPTAVAASTDVTVQYTVVATDTAQPSGNTGSASAALPVRFDTAGADPPTALAVSDGQNPRQGVPSISFTASDDPDGSVTYQLYRDGNPVGGTSSSTTLADPATSLADNTYVYTVRAYDGLLNLGPASAGVSVRIDNTGPAAPLNLVRTNGGSPRNTAPSFSFDASTDPSGVQYQLYRGGSAIGSLFTGTSVSDPSALATDATYVYTVRAVDLLGNAGASVSTSLSFKVDTTAPTVPTAFALDGSVNATTPPRFTYTSSTDADPITYELYRDGVLVKSDPGNSMTDTSLSTHGDQDGALVYTLRAVDSVGNRSAAASNSITVNYDSGPPSVPTNVHATANPTNSAPVVSWSASTGTPATYQVFRDGTLIQTVPSTITTITDPTVAFDGFDHAYTYTVVAIDAAQNASSASTGLKVTLDNTVPVPAGGLTATTPTAAKPALVWPRSASGDVTGYNVYRNGAQINAAPIAGTAFTDSGLSGDGTYRYTVRSIDAAGNVSSDSIGASVVYDTTPPAAPAVTAALGATHGTASLTWSAAADLGAGVSGYQVRRSAAGGAALTSMSEGTAICGTLPATALTCSDVGLAGGATYRYSVFAIDAVGNVSLAGQSGTISLPTSADTTPPKAPTTLHTIVSGGSVTISWKNPKADLAKVIVVWNASRTPRSATDGTPVYKGTGTKVSVKLSKLPSGKTVHVAVFALDKAGNASKATHANIAVPSQGPLSVAPGGKLSGSPKLSWKSVSTATYYNVQVFEGSGTSKRVGISWPVGTSWALPGSDLKKGKKYTWYVWPGVGAKAAAKYGTLIGKQTFVYTG